MDIIKTAKLAHPGKRYQGQFIDGMVVVMLFILSIFLLRITGVESNYSILILFTLPFGYFVLSDALPNGQTIGKKILGLSVVSKSTGKPCTIFQSIVRNIFTPILGVIDAVLIFGKKRQRLGDIMAGTIVIDIK